jgi:hypothetical protein
MTFVQDELRDRKNRFRLARLVRIMVLVNYPLPAFRTCSRNDLADRWSGTMKAGRPKQEGRGLVADRPLGSTRPLRAV